MGIEALFRDAPGLALRDPSFAKFLIGIIKGTLR